MPPTRCDSFHSALYSGFGQVLHLQRLLPKISCMATSASRLCAAQACRRQCGQRGPVGTVAVVDVRDGRVCPKKFLALCTGSIP